MTDDTFGKESREELEQLLLDSDMVINDLRTENLKLRTIASHVPARVYLEAKERAGYSSPITAKGRPMNEDAAAFAAKVAKEITEHSPTWRHDFLSALSHIICLRCGRDNDAGECWVCGSSAPENPENFDD